MPTIDPATKTISVPQSELTLVSGTLYELDTDQFRLDMNALMDDEAYIWMDDYAIRNAPVTVAGTTFAQTLEITNGWSVTFTPDSQYSVRLAGSNNNLFDVENNILNQNQVQVIAQNSAGLIDADTIAEQVKLLWQDRGFDADNPVTVDESAKTISVAGTVRTWAGNIIKTLTRTT